MKCRKRGLGWLILLGLLAINVPAVAAPVDLAWRKAYADKIDDKYVAYADSLEAISSFKRAATFYRKGAAMTTSPQVAGYATLCAADAYYAAGKYSLAVEYYKMAVENHAQFIDFNHAVTMLRTLAEDYAAGRTAWLFKGFHRQNARDLYRYIIGLAPFDARTSEDLMRLAELQVQSDLTAEAGETYKEVVRRFTGQPVADRARLAMAEMFLNESRTTRDSYRMAQAAEAQALALLERNPQNAEALAIQKGADEQYAAYYNYLGHFYLLPVHYRPEVAKRYLERAFKVYANTMAAPEAAKKWASLTGESTPATPVPAEQQVRESRELPPPPAVPKEIVPGLKAGDREAPAPGTPPVVDEEQRVRKWLLPIDDLGL